MGTGPVDASYKAIDSLVQVPVELIDYGMSSVTQGIEALATTRVAIRPVDGASQISAGVTPQGRPYTRTFSGTGADEDVVVSSARAYISALNKLISYSSARNQTPVTPATPATLPQTPLAV
jgi:2-isopropylmalate synthase